MSKFISFSSKGIPVEYIFDNSEASEVIKGDITYYRVPSSYDFDSNRAQYVFVNGLVKELTENESLQFQADIAKKQVLEDAKLLKIQEIDRSYSSSLVLNVIYSFPFKLDLRSKYGEEFIKVILVSIGSYSDEYKGKQISKLFFEVEDNSSKKQVQCSFCNWIWQYLFEELFDYIKSAKQLKDIYTIEVNNASTKESFVEKQFVFPYPDGLSINVDDTISKLSVLSEDNGIIIPQYVKDSLGTGGLFIVATDQNIIDEINTLVGNSCLN